jgi:hypothetical protein
MMMQTPIEIPKRLQTALESISKVCRKKLYCNDMLEMMPIARLAAMQNTIDEISLRFFMNLV